MKGILSLFLLVLLSSVPFCSVAATLKCMGFNSEDGTDIYFEYNTANGYLEKTENVGDGTLHRYRQPFQGEEADWHFETTDLQYISHGNYFGKSDNSYSPSASRYLINRNTGKFTIDLKWTKVDMSLYDKYAGTGKTTEEMMKLMGVEHSKTFGTGFCNKTSGHSKL